MTGPDEHVLSTEIRELPGGEGWRIVATCSCLGFGRKATVADRSVAEYGRLIAADYHAEHALACRTGREVPETRPSWLPPIGDAA